MGQVNNSERVIRRLYEITNSYDLGFDTQIEQILQMGLERFNLDIGILARIEDNRYVVKHCVVPEDVELVSGIEFDLDTTYCQITCQAKIPIALEHIGKHDRYASHPAYQSFGLESYIGMPIKLNGQLYGTLNFSSAIPYPRKFNPVDIDALQLMTSWIEVELLRRQQEKRLIELNLKLEKKAYEDSLTSIPNRRAMFKHIKTDLNRISREKGKVALAIIDIDFFKKVNDTYGHQKGDEILIKVAESLSNDKRDYDFLARFGGEEFLLWLPNCDTKIATKVCERIKNNIENLALCDHPLTISLGITCYRAGDLKELANKKRIDELISEADKALYRAKASGRNCIKFYQRSYTSEHQAIYE
ncbi:sensor domain-containing diguanylate cyclase [Psychromonas sp. Urea-02u-13]|uniref:sensor domain-containing diguanylate cyclase n=1 Tax=Psychromonas sp. Urea-02u-13 TaxID=2058326 RepID=UPI000C31D4BF|nr:sensor domain-containing diguanylate cyclase [Psychromonas sp. Urea-02u-13]PKG37298.1 diguanylate cyclase [Psychromonas sp. Urea-02u-13]